MKNSIKTLIFLSSFVTLFGTTSTGLCESDDGEATGIPTGDLPIIEVAKFQGDHDETIAHYLKAIQQLQQQLMDLTQKKGTTKQESEQKLALSRRLHEAIASYKIMIDDENKRYEEEFKPEIQKKEEYSWWNPLGWF